MSFPPYRFALAALLLSLLLTHSLQAGGRRRAVAAPTSADALTITFVDVPAATLDAGTIAWTRRTGTKGAAVTRRTFGIRIGRPSREARGTATLRAFLEIADPRAIVKLDGIVLGTQPRVIDRFTPIGITTTHRLEIEVPASAPEGALAMSIGWDVTTD
jgi:hypothetical protein